jgi:hypothetical protein
MKVPCGLCYKSAHTALNDIGGPKIKPSKGGRVELCNRRPKLTKPGDDPTCIYRSQRDAKVMIHIPMAEPGPMGPIGASLLPEVAHKQTKRI